VGVCVRRMAEEGGLVAPAANALEYIQVARACKDKL